MKNILVLGAGLVCRPLVRYLLDRTGREVVVASRTVSKAEALVAGHPRGRAVPLDVNDHESLGHMIAEADLVISLVPYTHHVSIAKLAIRHRIPVVTTSYVSPEMRALDSEARDAGVLVLNEIGLDPGIDHMSAMAVIDRVRATGGQVVRFASCCGGLPAAEANTNPWGYKFSWSPRGVILAGRNAARYRAGGKTVEVPGPDLFSHVWHYEVEGLGAFEIYPNRDSLGYESMYGLDGIPDMFRGTIRYSGWCRTLKAVADLGYLDVNECDWPENTTYRDVLRSLVGGGEENVTRKLAKKIGIDIDDAVMSRLEWAGLLSDRPIGTRHASPLDVVADRLLQVMKYGPGERDLIVLRHEFLARWPGRTDERIVSLLVEHGEPGGDSAMARTVSLPAAVASRLILEGEIRRTGVLVPVVPEVYLPVLAELENLGISCRETAERRPSGPFEMPRPA